MSDDLVKRPHKMEKMTHEQMMEFAKCADPHTGYEYFMRNYFYIQHPTKGQLKYNPFAYQENLIKTYHENRFSIALMPRQTGKSTSAAGYLLWYSMFIPDAIILIAAHKQSGASEIMQRIRYAYELCPDFIRCGAVTYNKNSLEFDNGSRIVAQATTENTGRGMSITLLYLDEFAFVRNTIAEEFWTAMRPTLATGGKCIITSTPNSDEDQFARIWKSANNTIDAHGNDIGIGINGFKAFRSYWHEHPDRDEKWAAEEEAAIGTERFRREHGCEFIIHEETLVSGLKLVEMEGVDPKKKEGQVRWYKEPEKGKAYLVGLDPAIGTGGDFAAIEVFELPNMTQVGEWMHNKTDIPNQVRILRDICDYLAEVTETPNDVYFSVENNSIGEAALISISEMGEENIRGTFLSEPKRAGNVRKFRKGFNTTETAKISACAKFKSLIESDRMVIHSKALISEMKTFVAYGRSYKAKEGQHDDLVMATLLVVRMAAVLKDYDPALSDYLRDHEDELIEPMGFHMIGGNSFGGFRTF